MKYALDDLSLLRKKPPLRRNSCIPLKPHYISVIDNYFSVDKHDFKKDTLAKEIAETILNNPNLKNLNIDDIEDIIKKHFEQEYDNYNHEYSFLDRGYNFFATLYNVIMWVQVIRNWYGVKDDLFSWFYFSVKMISKYGKYFI